MGQVIELRVRTITYIVIAASLGVIATLALSAAWRADAAPGDDDATYVAWPGCRLTDTRTNTQVGPRGSKLAENEVMTIQAIGDQGECTGDLALPADAVGLSTNVTVVDPTAQSNIRIYRGDLATPPNLSNLNVTPGAPPTPNAVNVQLAPDGTLKAYNFRGSVHLVIDVVGYFTDASLQELANREPAVGVGPVTMTHGLGPTLVNPDLPPKSIAYFQNSVRITSGGLTSSIVLPLVGPAVIGGGSYRLASLEYCMRDTTGGARVDDVTVHALTPSDFVSDPADRSDEGCYQVDVDELSVGVAPQGYHVTFNISGAVDSTVRFVGVQSTWTEI
ncbi:MAG: hypothetical protein AAGA42_13485 [Actinomycetota bacterium]